MGRAAEPALAPIIGEDPALLGALARLRLVAPTTTPVLITGESGAGKELFARALHELGAQRQGPFVAVNCGALPRELAESELFGHERGAFTGAAGRRAGWFEEASGGTLVLDEIGELPLELQPKLLRVLETGRLRRVGGTGEIAVRVRVVAMTLRNLESDVERRGFRNDLYYRLAGFCLRVPALRERRRDIALLAGHFLREMASEVGHRYLDASALAALQAATWPGNVRELRNVIRRAAILATGTSDGRIDADTLELPPAVGLRLSEGPPDPFTGHPAVDDVATLAGGLVRVAGRTMEEIERDIYGWALHENAGSRRRAARSLGIPRSTFYDKARRYSL